MSNRITTITLEQPLFLDPVNCYLIRADGGFVLVDTGPPRKRDALKEALAAAGCTPGTLKLILLTHGDFDHAGSAADLKERYGALLAMHMGDLNMLAHGDLSAGRRCSPRECLIALLGPLFVGFGKAERCRPDLMFRDGDSLEEYGLAAEVLALGAHSAGSLGLFVKDPGGPGGDLFCGDFLINIKGPAIGGWMPGPDTVDASMERLQAMSIRTVYPGHGKPFQFDEL